MHCRIPALGAVLLLGLIALCGLSTAARAQGILYPRPDVRIQPFYVKNLRVNAVVHDAVAETTVEQTFVNASSVPQEGTYLYPLPEGASPTSFSMTVGDRTLEPRILSKDEARSVYESIVRRRRDPALLEYVDRNLVRISVFPIPAQGERVIRMRYTELLKPESGLHKYAYSLSTSRFGARPVGVASVTIRLETQSALKNVYSPTHDLSIRRPDDHTATASWEGTNDTSDRDLTLYFSTGDDDVGLSLLTYKSGDHDGYFMLLASPRVHIPQPRILPKQVVFVLDRTGSMAGEKIQQARKSLLFCLNSLHPQDRFDLITFNESPDILTRHLEPATEANVAKARSFVRDIEASGGTNIDEALRAALDLLKDEEGRQKIVVFLTDGLPTVGETDINTILRHVRERNGAGNLARFAPSGFPRPAALDEGERRSADGAGARIFCFGVGYDVNVPFLDRLADLGRGDADYVKPEEDIETKVSAFFAKVTSPILSDLRLAFDGADVYDVYPKTLPDLFKGTQLVITGRFRGEGGGTVRLAGLANGTEETFRMATAFGEADGRNTFLPRLWAARKIGYLVDQLRLSSDPAGQKEVIDEIVRLSHDYGIITEYTSFLVDEQEQTALGWRSPSGFGGGGFGGGSVPGGQAAGAAGQLTPNGITDIFGYEPDNSIIVRGRPDAIREEVARRALQNGVSGEGAANQSLRAKVFQRADQVLPRYQTANGGVSTLNEAEPDQHAFYYKPGLGNFGAGTPLGSAIATGGRGGFGGGFGGRGLGGQTEGGAAQLNTRDANLVTVQAVADRTFYRQSNNVWQDQSYNPKKQKLVAIQAFSDAHFALLKAYPRLADYSSVGEEVIVRLGRNAIRLGKTGKETLTASELKELTGK